jgi:hypothetical protein
MVNELLVFLFDLAKNIIWYPFKLKEWRLTLHIRLLTILQRVRAFSAS